MGMAFASNSPTLPPQTMFAGCAMQPSRMRHVAAAQDSGILRSPCWSSQPGHQVSWNCICPSAWHSLPCFTHLRPRQMPGLHVRHCGWERQHPGHWGQTQFQPTCCLGWEPHCGFLRVQAVRCPASAGPHCPASKPTLRERHRACIKKALPALHCTATFPCRKSWGPFPMCFDRIPHTCCPLC